jgi:solute:Na+ symporter, SSS family
MNMTLLDWGVVGAVMALFLSMAYMANRLSSSVSDYLVAGRCAGRYMLTVASGTEWIGAIHIVAMFQIYYKTGLNGMWWVMLTTPIFVYIAISGWGIFRFRETRAMTLSEFLEKRYSPGIRIAAGVITWVTGILNFAIFPAVSAKVIITLLGLPKEFALAGLEHIPTFPVAAALMLIIPSFFVLGGGHTTVIVTDFIQGMFMNIVAVVIVTVLLCTCFNWEHIVEVLKQAPAGASKLDPIHTADTKDFNAYFFIINIIAGIYGVLSNVPSQGFMGSGKNAHEQRMGQLLGQLRWQGLLVFFMVIALAATMVLNHPAYRETAAAVNGVLDSISTNPDDESRSQAMVAAVLPHLLPVGVLGLFGAVLVAALISCHTGFMHAWGSVMLQDIIMPFRRRPFEPRAHIRALRLAIVGVCVVVYALSLLIKQQENILMYFAAVNSLWLGPAGALMLGGLYWSRGTKRGAVATLVVGVAFAAGVILLQQIWPHGHAGKAFPINGQWCFFANICLCVATYVLVSLTDRAPRHDMDKLLNRGAYAKADTIQPGPVGRVAWYERLFGITPMFDRHDKITAYAVVGLFLGFLAIFCVGMAIGFTVKPDADAWARFWRIFLFLNYGVLMVSTTWLAIGGVKDLMKLVRGMRGERVDVHDDGWVGKEGDRT